MRGKSELARTDRRDFQFATSTLVIFPLIATMARMRELAILSIRLIATLAKCLRPGGVLCGEFEILRANCRDFQSCENRARDYDVRMRDLAILLIHFLTTVARLLGPRPHEGQPLVGGSIALRVAAREDPLGYGGDGSLHPPDHRVCRARRRARRPSVCRMLNRILGDAKQLPHTLSSDHDPLFEFQRWKANLRILEIKELKTVPYVPLSHPFIERLIGTLRREFLDHVPFWIARDLERKLLLFKEYYNRERTHTSLDGVTPTAKAKSRARRPLELPRYRWRSHCRGLFQLPAAA